MFRTHQAIRCSPLLVGFLLAGCSTLHLESDKPLPVGSPLRTADASSDGLRFQVSWATLPPDAEVDGQASLWKFVQEERLDEGLRARLRRNGLRAGVVGGVPPREIARLLNPRPELARDEGEGSVALIAGSTGVKQQEMTVRPGVPALVNASEVAPEASLLLTGDRGPWGETFHQVQAVYRVGVEELAGGGQKVAIGPELHFGEPRMKFVAAGSAGITRAKPLREERAFPELRIEASLVVGEMLMVTSLPGSESRLGGFFHKADGEVSGARKAILVRLVQAPPEADFGGVRRSADRPEF
ncbi:hypothetical protein MalM25_35460 [Planctomycetes bacterium MalM25]|nr:hypothetical protein MalM25_35460 [Planctomycetes bacterium MalM25]